MIGAHEGYEGLVLAVHPTTRGFGWVLFENPHSPVDWGIASAPRGRNAKLIARFERLLDRHEPGVLVLEAFESRAPRIQDLCKAFIHEAGVRRTHAVSYPRYVVQQAFADRGAASRHEIAVVIAHEFSCLSHRLPRKRRCWEPDDARQSLFDAAALALTHYDLMGGR